MAPLFDDMAPKIELIRKAFATQREEQQAKLRQAKLAEAQVQHDGAGQEVTGSDPGQAPGSGELTASSPVSTSADIQNFDQFSQFSQFNNWTLFTQFSQFLDFHNFGQFPNS